MLEAYEGAFPGYCATEIDMIAGDDMVFIHWQISGTHSGPFLGYDPTGKKFGIDSMTKCKLSGGKFVEVSQVSDTFALFQQLGLFEQIRQAENATDRMLDHIKTDET